MKAFSALVPVTLIASLLLVGVMLRADQPEETVPASPAWSVQYVTATPTPSPTLTPTPTPTATATPTPTATPTAIPTATPTPTVPPPTATATPPPATGASTQSGGVVSQVRIPRFGVASAVEAIGLLPNNQMDVPKNPHNTGWYHIYDTPGQGGNALFAAHVTYYPNIHGPFYNLAQLGVGDDIIVRMRSGAELKYRVISNTRYSASTMPMGDIIRPSHRPSGQEWITLITCGGRFRSLSGSGGPGEYLDRDVVVAVRYE